MVSEIGLVMSIGVTPIWWFRTGSPGGVLHFGIRAPGLGDSPTVGYGGCQYKVYTYTAINTYIHADKKLRDIS